MEMGVTWYSEQSYLHGLLTHWEAIENLRVATHIDWYNRVLGYTDRSGKVRRAANRLRFVSIWFTDRWAPGPWYSLRLPPGWRDPIPNLLLWMQVANVDPRLRTITVEVIDD